MENGSKRGRAASVHSANTGTGNTASNNTMVNASNRTNTTANLVGNRPIEVDSISVLKRKNENTAESSGKHAKPRSAVR